MEDVTLEFAEDAYKTIAEKAIAFKGKAGAVRPP